MFKRESTDNTPGRRETASQPDHAASQRAAGAAATSAVIGASIEIDGNLRGEEDLIIEGKVNGTVELKNNSVTIGTQGKVTADIHAHTIFVEGRMEGSLVAAERIVIRKSADIKGAITSPRVSLEDGARFNGSIDMDPETEALKKAFGGQTRQTPKPVDSSRSDNSAGKPAAGLSEAMGSKS